MSWSSIIGQQRVKSLLKKLFEQNRLPHALLFHGPDGVGKDAVAIELATILNCESGKWDACGNCQSCRQMATLRHPRVRLIFPMPSKTEESNPIDKFNPQELEAYNEQIDAKAANKYHLLAMENAAGIKVSSIREIKREASYRTSGTGRAVSILSRAELMNQSASNALLKTLEEPSGEMLLILTTSKREALLPTILSRCQHVRFDPLTEPDMIEGLRRLVDVDETARLAVQLANGNFRDALSIAVDGNPFDRKEIVYYLHSLTVYRPIRIMEHLARYTARDDRATLFTFLSILQSWFRDVFSLLEGNHAIRNVDLRDNLEKFATYFPDTQCQKAIDEIENVVDMLRKNVHLTTAMIVLSQRLRRCIMPLQ